MVLFVISFIAIVGLYLDYTKDLTEIRSGTQHVLTADGQYISGGMRYERENKPGVRFRVTLLAFGLIVLLLCGLAAGSLLGVRKVAAMMEDHAFLVCNPDATVLFVENGFAYDSRTECLELIGVDAVVRYSNYVEFDLEDGSVVQIPTVYIITQ